MSEVEQLIKTTLSEIERILSTKSVVGEPMTVEGNTIIPLVAICNFCLSFSQLQIFIYPYGN